MLNAQHIHWSKRILQMHSISARDQVSLPLTYTVVYMLYIEHAAAILYFLSGFDFLNAFVFVLRPFFVFFFFFFFVFSFSFICSFFFSLFFAADRRR